MKGLSEKRLSDYMAEQIADEILAGRIEGGSQLKQEELAEVFGWQQKEFIRLSWMKSR